MDPSDEDLRHRCYNVAGRLLTTNQWTLLDREDFTRRCIISAKEHPAADLSYIAVGVYNQALYTACFGSEGLLRWERGYQELYEMLWKQARKYYPDVWEDAVQSALVLICNNLERCLVPQAFFKFAWGYVQNAVRSLRRSANASGLSLERTIGEDGLTLADGLRDQRGSIEQPLLDEESRDQLRTALDEFEQRHPGMRIALATVRLKFLDGKDDQAISQILGISVKAVYEKRSRCLKRLREDQSMRGLVNDLAD